MDLGLVNLHDEETVQNVSEKFPILAGRRAHCALVIVLAALSRRVEQSTVDL